MGRYLPPTPDDDSALVSPAALFALLIGGALGGVFAVFVLPRFGLAVQTAVTGPQPRGLWYLVRTSGFSAYALLWLSMASGVVISNRLARLWPGGPTAFALHEHTSLLALAFAAGHAILLLGDTFIGYSLPEIVIPFGASGYRPLEVGLGQIGFYALIVVTLTFYVRRRIGQRTWRAIHYASYAVFVLALLHGILSGTDSPSGWAVLIYWSTGTSLLALIAYRLWERREAILRELA